MTQSGWQFWIDRGGTFTDLVARAPSGRLHSMKLLSDAPDQYRDAAAESIRRILEKFGSRDDPITEIRMGTTVATNALLERSGPATALIINDGFADVLRIGNQQRPDIFSLDIRRPAPLYSRVIEVAGRLDADGHELEALNLAAAEQSFRKLAMAGIASVAICLMHAWKSARHELQLAELARRVGFAHVSVSHQVSPLMKLVERGVTTVADAYLSPVLKDYVQQFQQALAENDMSCARLLFMQSNGGLVSPAFFSGKDALLSGPAGGVIGMAHASANAGTDHMIGFDMGGTSTDVSVYAGRLEMAAGLKVAGLELVKPTLKVHTIAAGGGSLLKYQNGRLQVGPKSAGALPGPMAYGRDGPLTVTDANLMLGRIQPAFFPTVFGADGQQPLDKSRVQDAFATLAAAISTDSQQLYTPEQAAAGFLQVAVENMANAIRQVSVQRGLNPGNFTLCCFGGAAGQHACQLAERLGMGEILLDPMAGVLSARGVGAAPLRSDRQASLNRRLDQDSLQVLYKIRSELEQECREELVQQAIGAADVHTETWLELKQAGSDTTLSVLWIDNDSLLPDFCTQYRARFGFEPTDDNIVIASMRIDASGQHESLPDPEDADTPTAQHASSTPVTSADVFCQDSWENVPVYARAMLTPGTTLKGPALITEANSTTLLATGWNLEVNQTRQLVLQRIAEMETETRNRAAESSMPDPVLLEIYNNRLMDIATQMGAVLEQTAHSVNIKERLDFSCAIFDATGNLLANAPHMPVHLGSMDDSIRSLLAEHAEALRNGACFAANAPYNGGTHLPDITVISPLLDEDKHLQFIVAARAHHADIGGTTPGSMPPHSKHIDEEGVVLDNLKILDDGEFLEPALRSVLSDAVWPARNPDQNIADLLAQLAANERGLQLLNELIAEQGIETVQRYCSYLLDNAEETVRSVIERLSDGAFSYSLDNGQEIKVAVSVDHEDRSATIDFTGTSATQANNFNAPTAICRAAVMYVFRTLADIDIPLNAGCRQPLKLVLPEGCMLRPAYPAAVVGGNVETSQCVTDALFGALSVLAASQGTMNNVSFGDDELQYYETIAGGAGAGADFPGESAVQTHMTNTRITDPEVLESRYPVLIREFSIRKNSGGRGQHAGGDGVIRKLEFRRTMHAAILSNNRLVAPFGLNGGEPGQPGRNRVIRAGGSVEEYDGILATEMHAGDTLVIATPGGGGYGPPDAK